MRAIILNSGIGSRMGEYTSDKPKCMVEIKRMLPFLNISSCCLKLRVLMI